MFKSPQTSNFLAWPTKENQDRHYKFVGLFTELSQNFITVERKTYSILEWLGDVGGLREGLLLIGVSLVAPFANFALQFASLSNMTIAESKISKKGFSFRQSLLGLCC